MTFLHRPCLSVTLTGLLVLGAVVASHGEGFALTASEIAKLSGPDRQKILDDGARKEGKVVFYSSMTVNQLLAPMGQAFERRYPFVKFEYWRGDTAPILQKMTAERRANSVQHDVLEYSGNAVMTAIKADAVESFASPVLAPYGKDFYDAANGLWAGTRISYFGLAYNPKLVAANEVPKTYEDLLNPKWRDKLVWAISETGNVQFVAHMMVWQGDRAGEEYLKKLSAQRIVPFTASSRAMVDRVGQGEYSIALHAFANHPVISKAQGASLDVSMLEPIDSEVAGIQMAKGAPHPHAAMLLIDYVMSQEGQTVMREADYFPTHPQVDPKDNMRGVVPRLLKMKETVFKPETMFERRDQAMSMIEKYFK